MGPLPFLNSSSPPTVVRTIGQAHRAISLEQLLSIMLPNLVVELQLSIFSRLDTFRDALNLAATSRKLQQTWTQNKTYLADNILQQTVTSYPDAAAFAFAQLFAQKHAHTQVKYQCISLTTNTYPGIDKEGKRHDADKHPVLTPLQARILLNADIVSLSCSHFLTSTVGPDMTAGRLTQKAAGLAPRGLNAAGPATISPHRDPPFLTEREEERFHHAYYRVWAWLTYEYVRGSESEEKQKGIVEGCGLVEHWRMCEMAYFLVNDCSRKWRWPAPSLAQGPSKQNSVRV